jgi:ketosteroid isomerase-like protein
MANVIEIAKAAVIAYNEKDWSKAKDILAADAVYDEKGTHRRIQGAGEIIEAWQGWAKAFPDSKATFVREFASGDTAVLELKRRSHGPTTDANRYHSGLEQADRDAGLPGRPGRG